MLIDSEWRNLYGLYCVTWPPLVGLDTALMGELVVAAGWEVVGVVVRRLED